MGKHCILLVTLALLIQTIPAQDEEECINHTLNDCFFASDDHVLHEYTVPANDNLTAATLLCQNLCESTFGCEYFTYDTTTEACKLYELFDLQVRIQQTHNTFASLLSLTLSSSVSELLDPPIQTSTLAFHNPAQPLVLTLPQSIAPTMGISLRLRGE